MPYNFAADSFHTSKLCSRLSSSEVHFLYGNDKIVAFEAPFGGGGLGATYAVHLRLIGKLVGDFLLVLSQCTRLTDGRTDGQTDVDSKTVRMLRSRTVKMIQFWPTLYFTVVPYFCYPDSAVPESPAECHSGWLLGLALKTDTDILFIPPLNFARC